MKLNIKINNSKQLQEILGVRDQNLYIIKSMLGVNINILNYEIITDADPINISILENIFSCIVSLTENMVTLGERDIVYIVKLAIKNIDLNILLELYKNRKRILINDAGKSIYPKTLNQRYYVESIYNNDLVFGIGPAGTGKTYLAVALAVSYLKQNKVKKIILTRPAVEAGEQLGFLPGDLKEKVDPYLIPLYEALEEFLGKENMTSLIDKGVIEIAPLAYMRGRTLENSFVILDEAQNTTSTQMKMFLTRLGFNSKMVITGDPSQVDISQKIKPGLKDINKILNSIEHIQIVSFDTIDVIRHPLVQKILEGYEKYENSNSQS
ncbi:MAG: PhoH family protein [Acholeplasmatales bacterium]|jgi:phosphate starvation-inducible PhoH-like protein|nr:PhoH family protein [Acholeplasmatales bacterium]